MVPTPWLSAEQPASPNVLKSPAYGSSLAMTAAVLTAALKESQARTAAVRILDRSGRGWGSVGVDWCWLVGSIDAGASVS